jgi:IS605 OrfB family transposase
MILTRKIQLYPVGDKEEVNRVYQYIRDGIFNQNKAMNQYMTALYVSTIQDISKEDRQELNRLYTRIATSKKGSAYDLDVEFAKGLPTTSSLGQKVRQDFSKACKDGLLYGKVSLPTYRKDNPLLVHVDYVRLRETNPHKDNGIYHNYESYDEFISKLYDKDLEIFIRFANGITFKMILGQPHKSIYLREEIKKIFDGEYNVCGSSIQFNDKKIILNMSMDIPKISRELDENTVVGVDLGIAVPAVCGLNNSNVKKQFIGSKEDFLRIRTQLQAQRKRLQKNVKITNGGHGRNKKLKALDKLSNKERNFVKTYNHYVSKQVIDFALKNNAKYINMEDLSGFNTNKFILRNWSFYELQQFITYKAQRYGIEVRKINPYHTSQICSKCGHWEEGQRDTQDHFKCKACGYEDNADFNASKNIAKSIDFRK